MNFHPATIATPAAIIATPPTVNTSACCPTSSREIADAPSPSGRMIVAIPAANTSVIAASWRRR